MDNHLVQFPFPKHYQHLDLSNSATGSFVQHVYNNNDYLARAPRASLCATKHVVLENDRVVLLMDDRTSSKVDRFFKIAVEFGLDRFIARPLEFSSGRLVLERTFGALHDYLWYFKIYHGEGFLRFLHVVLERLRKWLKELEQVSVKYKFCDGNIQNLHIQFPLDMPLDLEHVMDPDNLRFVFIDLDSWNTTCAQFPRFDELIHKVLNRQDITIGSSCSAMVLYWLGLAKQLRWDFLTELQLAEHLRLKNKRPFDFDTTDNQDPDVRRKRVKINAELKN